MASARPNNGSASHEAGTAVRTHRKRVEWQLEEPAGAAPAAGGRAIPTPASAFPHGLDGSADTQPPPALSSSLSRSFGAGLPSWLQDLEQRQQQQQPNSPHGGLDGGTEALLAARLRGHAAAALPAAQPALVPALRPAALHQPPAALRPQEVPAQPGLRPHPQAPQPQAQPQLPASQQRGSPFMLPPQPAPQPAGLLVVGAAPGASGALPPPPAPHQIAPPGYLLVPHPHPQPGRQPPMQPPAALIAPALAPQLAHRAGVPAPQPASRTGGHGGPPSGQAAPHHRMPHHGHAHHHASQNRQHPPPQLEPGSSGYATDVEAGGVNGGGGGAGSEVESGGGGRNAAATLMRVGSAPTRGRSGFPRVSSISEIEPHVEEEAPRLSSSMLTRAIMIPGGADRPRTYRVAPAKSQGSQDSVTVVLEGAEEQDAAAGAYGGVGGSVRGGRGLLSGLGYGHAGSNYPSYGSSLPGSGGAAAGILGAGGSAAVPPPSSSFLGGSLLSGLFGGRGGGGAAAAAAAPGGATPDSSVHGPDSYYGVPEPASLTAFGSLPTSSSLLRARGLNASAGSILTKATGGLKTQMKKSTSSGNFGSLWPQPAPPPPPAPAPRAAGAAAAGVPLGAVPGAGAGAAGSGRAPRSSVTGGSGGSSAGTSAGGSGLGFWMRRSATLPHRSSGAGADGAASGTDGSAHGGNASGRGSGHVAVSVSRQNTEPDLADLAMLATSLPASLGTWSMPRSMALASSPAHAAAAAGFGSRPLSRANSTVSATSAGGGSMFGAASGSISMGYGGAGGAMTLGGGGGSGAGPSTVGPPTYPICLICLEVLAPEEFESGEAISLQCLCKGEVSLRHRRCAIEWSHHKGDVVCDICKQPIANLPPIPDEVMAAREAARRRRQPAFNTAAEPNLADHIFDCIRATWVTMIICVLFFDMTVGQAFLVGAIIGVAFASVTMTIAACARRARARAAARAVERATEESRAAERRQQQQQQQQQRGSGGAAAGEASLTTPLLSGGNV
ncbi:hypothetical protein HXX76_006743 [Chlamydomonas incerta]|uniref:RING-CH-type domain-containing protein n=1 Tax=Chlamydomonas incerta TaxID=51695 RepID=A0A835TCQ8_CHLIN|nr:hypothetical protein HXX76_006743 [Chlamydomonas incerta]|eukprot:KAG2436440.1 hypothetical protein HXX76_006743 [Chlamydomonas incerta]